ncbi:UDP-N-acetylmuramoyl-L-alanyl-D-glutamate--2,6-diaminopimelate ligase [Solimonas terrae]|uniref:UDP-N-acetylmuramoyl-L-alanyl-D-glutamate--2,6-diaminopimelate ligase n=1 Tax=Solimonas terrae TaxID=1396819 RepID=A0A6M2BTY2_9GAMM|nr:UDP-N-acetylmuramoyl-L-alanyl-D-glutamate--2,6-diaminopimelate ligase [Solimonas terrae]NGY05800.1 UDP-N-acetylmuramoyl-L-alanyl-D-glutamate--2,6-diaminopimelate ligase [Solimonas terrae]
MSGAAHSLRSLLAGYDAPAPDFDVTGVEIDSRKVSPGDLFLACKGSGASRSAAHGLSFIEQVLQRGAAAVAWEPASGIVEPDIGIPQVPVAQLSQRAGEIAARFHDHPSRHMYCVGVTGTDGKTSTAYLIAQAFEALHQACGYLGTIGMGRVGALATSTHTTPDPISLQQWLAQMRRDGVRTIAMEVSSHALDQARVAGTTFRTAVLTNISRDHLDYHGTVEAYAAAKRKLFERSELLCAVLNRDDVWGRRWIAEQRDRIEVISYGIDGEAPATPHLIARELALDAQGLRFTVDSHLGAVQIRSRLLGRFNVHNLLAALGALISHDIPLRDAAAALEQAHTVPGRIEGFRGAEGQPLVVVDYAHTPEALRQVLTAVRAHTAGRLLCVFGCGGDRDRGKRPLMAAAALALADTVFITDDNPRHESPQAIVAEILAGIALAPAGTAAPRVEHDRASAIRMAIAAAGRDDVVVIAGKGHEDYQIYGNEVRSFSDRGFVAGQLGVEPRA